MIMKSSAGNAGGVEQNLTALVHVVKGRSSEVRGIANGISDNFFGGVSGGTGAINEDKEPAGAINSAECALKSIIRDINAIEAVLAEIQKRIA